MVSPPVQTAPVPIRYVALGDSYTIGTSVTQPARWPDQLVAALRGRIELELLANLGVNGYASRNLINDELPVLARLQPGFVSILIGVNDVVRFTPADAYRANVAQILDVVLGFVPADRILVVSTPDYTRTPAGASFGDPAQQRAEIANFNGIMRAAADSRGIAFVDIGPVADMADRDDALVANDGLHPSGEQYHRWVELIAPVVEGLFSGSSL